MDWYFIPFFVAFCVVALGMIMFAFCGPSCNDFEESVANQLNGEFVTRQNVKSTCSSMPLPPEIHQRQLHPSLEAPYPPNPPPLGFGQVLAEPSTATTGTFPYPLDEEISRMPFPMSSSYVYASTSSNAPQSQRPEAPQTYTEAVGGDDADHTSRRSHRRRVKRLSQ